jgi:hypothetical protein
MYRGIQMRLKHCLEPVDLMVIVGVCATVFGAYALFMSSNGTLRAGVKPSAVLSGPVTIMDAMDWVQPALGQAIVEDVMLEQEMSKNLSNTALRLSQAIIAAMRLEPSSMLDQIRHQAQVRESAHTARVEFVLGRTIVESTKRGIRTGTLSVDQMNGPFNQRLVSTARASGAKMEAAFRESLQPGLGLAIVQASVDLGRLQDKSQQKLGETIRDLTIAQEGPQAAQQALQEQLAATVIAAVRTELRADLLTQLAAVEFPQPPALPLAAPATLPAVPSSLMVGATGLLVAVFLLGLRLAGGTPTIEAMDIEANGERWEPIAEASYQRSSEAIEVPQPEYRKSA